MDKNIAIEFDGVGKQYRLGLVGTGSLQHDINRWWQTAILRKEDPYLKIGEVNDRSKKGTSDYVWALKDISFKVEQGDVVGIIGKNGAGKSTLLKLLSHITAPSVGHIRYRGRIASLLEVGTGFHPEMTARQNIYMNGSIMGMTRHEITSKLDEIVDFAGIERYLDTPVKRFSSGMTVRLGFAVAAFLEPEILVVDEVLAVGDAEFQKKAIGKMKDVSSHGGRTVLFVSHNMAAVRNLCRSGIVLKNGMIDFLGTADESVNNYIQSCRISEEKPFSLLKDIVYYNGSFKINRLLLNGKNPETIYLDECNNCISVDIEADCLLDFNIEFIFRILDRNENLIASYNCTNVNGTIYHSPNGKFVMNETIIIPENISNGEYLVQIHLTQRNINYLAQIPFVAKMIKHNFTSPYTGGSYSMSGTGYLVLSGHSNITS